MQEYCTVTSRFTVVSVVAFIVLAATSACSTRESQRDPQPTISQSTAGVQLADLGDDDFCSALRQAGITNTAALSESSDPAALLATLDALAPKAPITISTDFAAFDRLEHVLLDPASADPAAPPVGPETRGALSHVAAYLHNTCHITQ
jgi:hypothetical protein